VCPRRSSIAHTLGFGVYAATPVRKGTRLVEYTGPRITAEEADRLYDAAPRTYLYGLDDGKTVIDGEGLGAYLNHSCDPNCEIDEIKGPRLALRIARHCRRRRVGLGLKPLRRRRSRPLPLRLPEVPRHHVFPRVDGQTAQERSAEEETESVDTPT